MATDKDISDNDKGKKLSPWAQIIIFMLLALLILAIVVGFPDLHETQHFYLRIIIALAAAGMAAVLTPFIELEISILNNSFRLVSTLGIFILIYNNNPPPIESYNDLDELAGEWVYECDAFDSPFPHGGMKHGGVATFLPIRNKHGYSLSITGKRTWVQKGDEKLSVNTPSSWESISANITSNDRILYEYRTNEQGVDYSGFSSHKIITNEQGNILRIEGTFNRMTTQLLQGSVTFKRLEVNETTGVDVNAATSLGINPALKKI